MNTYSLYIEYKETSSRLIFGSISAALNYVGFQVKVKAGYIHKAYKVAVPRLYESYFF